MIYTVCRFARKLIAFWLKNERLRKEIKARRKARPYEERRFWYPPTDDDDPPRGIWTLKPALTF